MKYKVSPDIQIQALHACVRYLYIFTQAHSLLAVQHFFSAGSKTTPVVVHSSLSRVRPRGRRRGELRDEERRREPSGGEQESA